MFKLRTLISRSISKTSLAYLPVRVRCGPAKDAKWTLAPFSHNWRHGGESDLEPGLSRLPRVDGAVCWDFGAHFGIHTIGMALHVGPSGQVVAFEPDPGAFQRLQHHVKINNLSNVRLFQAAVSNTAREGNLITTHGLGSSFSHLRYEDERTTEQTPIEKVQTVVADELVSRRLIRPPDLIKVDIQGHGAKALEGSIRSIREKLPIIIFSSHSPWELNDTRRLLEPFYSVSSLQGASMSWDDLKGETGLLLPCDTST